MSCCLLTAVGPTKETTILNTRVVARQPYVFCKHEHSSEPPPIAPTTAHCNKQMAAETKYSVLPLDLKSDQGEEKQTVVHPDLGKLSKLDASFIPSSVRKECFNGELPPAPLKCLVEATVCWPIYLDLQNLVRN